MRPSIKAALVVFLACVAPACGAAREDPAAIDPQLQAELESWLAEHGQPPVDYVVGLFADHDVVFLGEWHRIKHDPELVQAVLAPLYEAGVRTLATEFARRDDQALIDSLTTEPKWREDLARRIVFNNLVVWGYREYVDVLRAAWEVNRARPEGAPTFRALALNDSPDWSLLTRPEDRDDPQVMRRVWRGGGEQHWARVILDAVAAGEFVRFVDDRAGNHVFRAIGKRAVTVVLHAPWSGPGGYDDAYVHPADGVLDAFMRRRDGGPYAVGFDLVDSPFGRHQVRNAVYVHGYGEAFTPARFADGWIYTRPLGEYQGVTTIPDWITKENLEQARRQMPNPDFREASCEDFNAAVAHDAEIPRRLAGLR